MIEAYGIIQSLVYIMYSIQCRYEYYKILAPALYEQYINSDATSIEKKNRESVVEYFRNLICTNMSSE